MTDAQLIVTHFCIPEPVTKVAALGEGFINDTFLVETAGTQRYILQRKNKTIFSNVPGMMDNIARITEHIRSKGQETLQLLATEDGKWFYTDNDGEYWACCVFIENSVSYECADTPGLIRSGGMGVGQFQSLLADFEGTLEETLPGFHNIRYRFEQFAEAVKNDAAGRLGGCSGADREEPEESETESGEGSSEEPGVRELRQLVNEIWRRKPAMMDFYRLIENGDIPKRISHNDTKLSNFLFRKDGSVLCAIDLDTVMQSSVLYDYGDAIRSYSNTCPEDEKDPGKVRMDPERFTAFTEGYLSEARFLNETEKDRLVFSALYITYEQYLRFLMDYINGDTYYKIRYPTHNLVRARAQLALLKSMEAHYNLMQQTVKTILINF
ncbi:MAG TPA: aminoglycoside phosphotransferase family protein [Bacteroidales bacterium]|nr:aminoglycoside phosphotransferase family protein [Bacteroidales bacterium]